jgi:hypothetical protein
MSQIPAPALPAHNGVLWGDVAKHLTFSTAECWVWSGKLVKGAFPRMTRRVKVSGLSQVVNVRRLCAEFHGVHFPTDRNLTPSCGNGRCVSPHHTKLKLECSTPNQRPPTPRSNAKLDLDKAREIRRAHAAGEQSQHQLAQSFSVSIPMINQILKHKVWRES